MVSTNENPIWADPERLVKEATTLLDSPMPAASPEHRGAEEAIVRAHDLVSPDLYVIDRLKQVNVPPDYRALFGAQAPEKTAALTFLTKQKLLDIEQCTLESRDLEDARRDLVSYVEILFRLEAADALMVFYDLAASRRNSRTPRLWHNVRSRCLYLLALLLTSCHDQVLALLAQRPDTRPHLESLLGATDQRVAGAFRDLLAALEQYRPPATPEAASETPSYLSVYRDQYERAAVGDEGRGVSTFLSARDRIQQAIAAGDMGSVVQWIGEGSPAATREVFRHAMSLMSTDEYLALLEKTLAQQTMDPVRLAMAVLELGNLNRSKGGPNGSPRINRTLHKLALADEDRLAGVARLAVKELGSVNVYNGLVEVAAEAPLIAVAEEAIAILLQLRRLPLVEGVVERRPALHRAYLQARREQEELQSLTEAASACPSQELALMYLQRLRERRAVPELEQLAHGSGRVSEAAQRELDELRAELPQRGI